MVTVKAVLDCQFPSLFLQQKAHGLYQMCQCVCLLVWNKEECWTCQRCIPVDRDSYYFPLGRLPTCPLFRWMTCVARKSDTCVDETKGWKCPKRLWLIWHSISLLVVTKERDESEGCQKYRKCWRIIDNVRENLSIFPTCQYADKFVWLFIVDDAIKSPFHHLNL